MTFYLYKSPGSPALTYLEGPPSGPPLVFLHGVGRSAKDYSKLAQSLAEHWHVHMLDFRGHGAAGRADGNYLVVDYIGDTLGFIRTQFTSSTVLYGHSLGAMVALAVAAELPASIRALVLEDPPFHTMGRWIAQTPWHPLFVGMREVARQGGPAEALCRKLADVRVPLPKGIGFATLRDLRSREALEFSAQCLSRLDPEVFTPVIEGRWLDGYDEGKLFARAHCPILLLQGDPDAGGALTNADAQQALVAAPNCRLKSFPGVGHLIHGDQPNAVLLAFEEFTATLASAAPDSLESDSGSLKESVL